MNIVEALILGVVIGVSLAIGRLWAEQLFPELFSVSKRKLKNDDL